MNEFPPWDGGSVSASRVPSTSELHFARAVRDMLQEKEPSAQLIDALKQRKNLSSDSFVAIFSDYYKTPLDDKLNFQWMLHNWIGRQLLPYMNYKIEAKTIVSPPPTHIANTATTGTKDIENIMKTDDFHVINTNIPDNSCTLKQKKRMTPCVVSGQITSINSNILTSNIDSNNDIRAALFSKRSVESINNIEHTPKKDLSIINDKVNVNTWTNRSPQTPVVSGKSRNNPELYVVEKDNMEIRDVASDTESLQIIRRLSKIYALLILNNYLPYSYTLPFVTRVVSLQVVYDNPIVVKVIDQEEFPSVILSSKLLRDFIIKLLNDIKPVIKCLGSAYINALVNLKILKDDAPAFIAELTSVVEETANSTIGNTSQSMPRGPETFIRPFREEIDSRNEYKSPTESVLYNERESCYDEFTNCFHRFQDILKSDYDGGKIRDFFLNNNLNTTKLKVLSMQDVNFIWFGEIFKQMLLFYGVNSSVGNNASYKHRLLERLGGSKVSADVTNDSPGLGRTFNHAANDKSMAKDYYEIPAANFPGNQQFFFRFIIYCDSHRLSSCLVAAFTAEIYELSALTNAASITSRPSSNSSSTSRSKMFTSGSKDRNNDTYTSRIVKLKLLGKFLGLLHFYSQWILSVPANVPKYSADDSAEPSGPISLLLEESVRNRALFRCTLPIKNVLELAYTNSRYLSLIVPWICEFLKMIIYDNLYHIDNPYVDILGFLKSLQRSDSYCPLKCTDLSPNKLFILLEIETLWSLFPLESIRAVTLPILPSHKSDSDKVMSTNTLPPHFYDEGNGAFSDTVFNTSIAPCINSCIQCMRTVSGIAKSSIEKKPVNPTRLIPKRQTPNIISNKCVDANPTFTSHSSGSSTPSVVRLKSNDSNSNNSVNNSAEKKSTSKVTLMNPSLVSPSKGYSDINVQPLTFSLASPSSPKKMSGSVSYGSCMSSPSMSSPSKGDDLGSVYGTLEAAFWQQHTNLHQICTFMTDNLHNACMAHLKDKVAEAILELWSISGRMKLSLENILSSNASNASTIKEYQRDLLIASKRLHEITVKDGNDFIQEFIDRHIHSTLSELCYHLYPNYQKVSSLAEKLITNQIKFQETNLVQYLDTYSLRKFDEVVIASIRQYQKLIDGSTKKINGNTNLAARMPANSRENPVEGKRSSFTNEDADSNRFMETVRVLYSKIKIYFKIELVDDSCPEFDPFVMLLKPIRINVIEGAYNRGDSISFRNNIAMTIDIIKELYIVIGAYYSVKQKRGGSAPTTSHVSAANNVLRTFLSWINVITKSSGTDRTLADKVLIDTYKFLTILSPILIFLDYLVSILGDRSGYSSDILLEALLEHKLFNTSTFIRLLITTARPTTGSHYEAFRGLTNISKILNSYILHLIKRFLMLQSEISDLFPPADCDGAGEEWYNDSSLLHAIRSRFGPELPILIAKLISIGKEIERV